jgi:hypothetical protein
MSYWISGDNQAINTFFPVVMDPKTDEKFNLYIRYWRAERQQMFKKMNSITFPR